MNKSHNWTQQLGFTLIELLTVIVIISAMLIIALPRFDAIAKRSALDSATSSVVAALNLARQHALTHRQPTYLLILGDNDPDSDLTDAFSRYAIYTIKLNTTAQPENPIDGEFVTDWNELPEGVVFDNTDDRPANIFVTSSTTGFTGGFDDYSRLKVDETIYYACGFTPSGQRETADTFLYLAEGFYRENGRFQPTTISDGNYHSMLIHIFKSGTINVGPEKATAP